MSMFKELLQMSMVSVPIILFVILIRILLKRAPKIFSYTLWGVVLFRLLCPVSFTSDFSFIGLLEYTSTKDTIIENSHTEVQAVPDLPRYNYFQNNLLPNTVPTDVRNTVAPSSAGLYDIFFFVWITGVSVIVVYSLYSYIRLKRKLSISMPLSDNIYVADHISMPFVIGIFKPRIYLPSGIAKSETDYIITHEQHHIDRKDHVIKLIAFSALCLHWFNPIVWLAFSLAVRDMEMSCDEAVLKKLGKSECKNYSQTLLSLSVSKQHFSPSPIAFGEGNTKVRIKNVMKYKKPTFLVIAAAIIVCISTALFLASNPSREEITSPFGLTYDFSDAKRYIYHDSIEEVMKPTVTISEENKLFHFTYSMFSSYLAHGHYSEKDGKLIMDCGDGKIFTFRKTDDDTLVFLQSESSPIPKYRYSGDSYIALSPVPDGAVFTKINIVDGIIKEPTFFESDNYLEKAVSSAIIQNYKGNEPDGLIHTESHIILDTDELHGLRTVDGTENISKKNVYTISMHTSYSVIDGKLTVVSCDFAPAIIKFIINADNSLSFDNYFIPGKNGDYHFQKKTTNYFTEDSYKEALDYEKYRDKLSENCYNRAMEFLNSYNTEYSESSQ